MSEQKKPVVVYGVSGYTGRLVCEYLREYNIPFIAAGRDKKRVQAVVDKIPGIETADYEVVEVEHSGRALDRALPRRAKSCAIWSGPFIKYGDPVVEACLDAGCHYTDTTGEQDWVLEMRGHLGRQVRREGSAALAEPRADVHDRRDRRQHRLETPGLDTLDILVFWKGFPTYASTQTIFTILKAKWYYLEQNKFVEWDADARADVVRSRPA